MGFMQVKFSVFLLFSAAYPKISHQALTCGDNNFFIQYPFQLVQEGKRPHHRSHFILKCNSQGLVVINLPFSGEFYVRDIDYFEQKIQLYDPGNCLPGRMKNLSLSLSPFVAVAYQNYTFFSCPPQSLVSSHNISVISCLSNSTASILGTSLASMRDEIKKLAGCEVIYSLQIPVSQLSQYEYNGFVGDLELAWSVSSSKGRSPSLSVLSIIIACVITISTASLVGLFCIACCLHFARLVHDNNEANIQRPTRIRETARTLLPPAWQQQPQPSSEPSMATDSIDKLRRNELIRSGRHEFISGYNSGSCPICLEEYKESEKLWFISRCNHCFHADCIQKWLLSDCTCPICRIFVI